jgi:hypothetical protein
MAIYIASNPEDHNRYGLRVFEKRVLRKIFGAKRD